MAHRSTTRSFRETLQYTEQWFNRLILGGYWALGLPQQIRDNMRWYWFDGLFAAASDNVYATYLTVYLVTLGATKVQIGLMSSLQMLAAAAMLIPGALLAERVGGRRKEITALTGGGISRLMFLLLAAAPLIFGPSAVIWACIVMAVTREGFGHLGFPGWVAMTGDIVPPEGRGRYFGSRFFVMGVATMATALIFGALITAAGQPLGYEIAFAAAFLISAVSTYCFIRVHDPAADQPKRTQPPLALRGLWASMRQHPAFVILLITTAIWNFALFTAGPFFTVYLVENLKATAAMVGITSAAQQLTTLLLQRWWGDLTDRWGPRRVQMLSMLTIPIVPLLWTLAGAAWHIIGVNMVAGALWSGYTLASFSFLLHLAPETERARYSALYQLTVTLASAGGAAFGSLLITMVSFKGVFVASAVGRMIAALLFVRLLRDHHIDEREMPAEQVTGG